MAVRNGPSRSAQSTSGERCAAAVVRICDSTMQPSMILKPSARAVWIIASAARMPPHLTSLTLMPSTQPSSAGRSRASFESSSTTIGIGERSRIQRNCSGAPAGIGCSQNSISYLAISAQQPRGLLGRPALVGVDADRAG